MTTDGTAWLIVLSPCGKLSHRIWPGDETHSVRARSRELAARGRGHGAPGVAVVRSLQAPEEGTSVMKKRQRKKSEEQLRKEARALAADLISSSDTILDDRSDLTEDDKVVLKRELGRIARSLRKDFDYVELASALHQRVMWAVKFLSVKGGGGMVHHPPAPGEGGIGKMQYWVDWFCDGIELAGVKIDRKQLHAMRDGGRKRKRA